MMLPFVLILKEPDLGSALVLLPTGLVMMFVAGTPRRYLLQLVGAVGLAGRAVSGGHFVRAAGAGRFRCRRISATGCWFILAGTTPILLRRTPRRRSCNACDNNSSNDEYNVRQALISVGSGGLIGKGWRQGTQNALGYLPRAVAHNDFIFSVIAEEEGFVGSVIVLTLYAVVLFTGLRIAGQARDRLGKLVAVGVVTLIFSHVFINIGMNIRIMPVTGMPLPLLSYGGSSVLCSLIAVGLMQNIHIHRKRILTMSNNNFSRRRRGMRFRPKGGLGPNPQKPDREAIEARADVVSEQGGDERVFEKRHSHEIERAENIAAGLPPQSADRNPARPPPTRRISANRIPKFPRQVQEEKPFAAGGNQGAAEGHCRDHQDRRGQPRQKSPAAHPPGKTNPQGSHHQRRDARNARRRAGRRQAGGIQHRAHDRGAPRRQHLQGQRPQPRRRPEGRVRGHRLREKRVPALLGHRAQPVRQRRGNRRARRPAAATRPKITQKDIPRLYPPGSEIIVQVTKGPIGTKGPRVTTNLVLPGRYLVLLPNSDQSGISRKIENQEERKRLKKILRELHIPDGMGVIMRTAGEGQQQAVISCATSRCCSRNGTASQERSKSSRWPPACSRSRT